MNEIKKYLSKIGARGGKSTSPRKQKASKENLKKALEAKKRLSTPPLDS